MWMIQTVFSVVVAIMIFSRSRCPVRSILSSGRRMRNITSLPLCSWVEEFNISPRSMDQTGVSLSSMDSNAGGDDEDLSFR